MILIISGTKDFMRELFLKTMLRLFLKVGRVTMINYN